MTKKIIIIGATGGSADIGDIINDVNTNRSKFDVLGYLDDNEKLHGKAVYGITVLGGTDLLDTFSDDISFVSGIGSQKNFREKPAIIEKWNKELNRYATIIHPSANISSFSTVGKGSIIHPNVTIGPEVVIGNFVQVLPNTVVSHHSRIDDFTIINGSCLIAGDVTINENCYIGAKTAVRQNITIGSKTLIGMGSLVLNNIPSSTTAYGSPAKNIHV